MVEIAVTEADKEREAIVAWLRRESMAVLNTTDRANLAFAEEEAGRLRNIASAIQRGEHLK